MNEQSLESSPQFDVFDRLLYPVSIIGSDGELIFRNKSFKEMIESKDQSISLDTSHPFFHEYRKRIAVAYHKAFSGEDSKCFAVLCGQKGEQIPAEIYLYPMKSEDGSNQILAFIKKVDDRMLSFDADTSSLDSSEDMAGSNILEFSPFPIIRLDSDLNIISLSASTEELCGKSRESLLKKKDHLFQILSPYDNEKLKNNISSVFKGENGFKRMNDVKIESGDDMRWINIFIYPVTSNKVIKAVEVVVEEITRIKKLESKITLLNRMQVVNDLTKGLLHSFNNIINIIISKSQMLLHGTENKAFVNGLKVINDSAQEGAHQIRRVQDFIGDTDVQDDEKSTLIEIIEDAIEFSKINFKVEKKEKNRDITLNKQYYHDSQIMGNVKLLREVFVSMIFKVAANISTSGTIDVELKRDGDFCLHISASKDFIDDECNSPVESFMSELEIRRTAEKINLRIFEEESPEKYLIRAIIPARMVIDEDQNQKSEPEFKLRDLDVLIVEDEPALQDILLELFDTMGNRVKVFDKGGEAIEELRKHPFDLVISDYGLSGITGVELLARAKELNESVVTVLLSGWLVSDINSYKNTVDLFLQKPFQIETLITEISKVMAD